MERELEEIFDIYLKAVKHVMMWGTFSLQCFCFLIWEFNWLTADFPFEP